MVKFIKETCLELTTFIIVVGGGVAYYYSADEKATAIMAAIMLVLGYWFGTSAGSSKKNETIDKTLREAEKRATVIPTSPSPPVPGGGVVCSPDVIDS